MHVFLQPPVVLLKYEDEPFLPPGVQEKLEEEARTAAEQAEQAKYDEDARRRRLARERDRREAEEADLTGHLPPDAEVFRDLRLKPRIKEAHEYEAVPRTPIVQNLFFKNSLTWVAGQSGTFKSFVTADLAFRYGSGEMDYHGRRMTNGRALLIIAEGAAGYADRKVAWEKHHRREVKNVSIYPAPLQLGDTLKEMPALRSYLQEEADNGRPFDLVVFDTQAMCTVGVDENTSEMNKVVNVLHRIREVNGACVLVVHHFGKDPRSGMRGSSMIYAAADTVVILKRKEDDDSVILSTSQADGGKQKDAITEKDLLEFEMAAHPVGEDYFGDTIFSLVPVSVDSPQAPVAAEAAPLALPVPTETQMEYLRALSFFRHHGAGQSELAKKMTEDGIKTYGSLVRSKLIAMEDKGLVEIHTGKWKVTPIGGAVLMREKQQRAQTEQSWVERPGRNRRKPPQNQDQTMVPEEGFGTLGETPAEAFETPERNPL